VGFAAQCPQLLAQADDFAHECLSGAREQRRFFYPVGPEVHSAYFHPAADGSHFALGCTLNVKHQIEFLGIYYALSGDSFKIANTAPLGYIDFQGDVGIVVDGELINLIAVRQFGTDLIPLRYLSGTVKNCEGAILANGNLKGPRGGWYTLFERRDAKGIWMRDCVESACLPDSEYVEFFGGSDNRIIFHDQFSDYFIESGGGIFVKKAVLLKQCPIYDAMRAKGGHPQTQIENVTGEVCLSKSVPAHTAQ
jgi:hypothetical protein